MEPELKTLLRPKIVEVVYKSHIEDQKNHSGLATQEFLLVLAKQTDEELFVRYVDACRHGTGS